MNGLDPFTRLDAPALEREPEERREETERLAALFAQLLPQALNPRLGLAEESTEGSSESWQASVGDLTPTLTAGAPASAEAEGAAGPSDSVVFSVSAGDLGELRCRLDRSEAGVRVLIGVDGRNALTAAATESGVLEAALRAAGLEVSSVAVVPLAKFGTGLAQGDRALEGRPVRQAFTGSRERTRRVKLIG